MRSTLFMLALVALALGALCCPLIADAPVWTSSGPYGGRILAVGVSPASTSRMAFSGTDGAGLYNAAADSDPMWTRVVDLGDDLTVSSVAFSPGFGQDRTMFISTLGSSILTSADGGATWLPWSYGIDTSMVAEVAVSPGFGTDQLLIAATDKGLHRSVSVGKVWSQVGPAAPALSVAITPKADPGRVAFGGTVIGLYISEDGGAAWTPVAGVSGPVQAIALSPDYASDETLVAGTLSGAYRSADGGDSWATPWLSDRIVHSALFSPAFGQDGTILLGTDMGVFVSTDSGAIWGAGTGIEDSVHALAAIPSSVGAPAYYAGTGEGGVYVSPDGGLTWAAATDGIAAIPMTAVAVSPAYTQDRAIYAGGPSGAWRSLDDGLTWERTPLDDAEVHALRPAVDHATSDRVYAATDGGLYVSGDRGNTWIPGATGLDVSEILDVDVSPVDEIWVATSDGVRYSPDTGETWEDRSQGLGHRQVTAIRLLASDGDADHLVAGTWGEGVYRSSDGGQVWESPGRDVSTSYVRALESGAGLGDRVWAFAATTAGGYRSGDLGKSWDQTLLLGTDISDVALHPDFAAKPHAFAGATQSGVFRSVNGGIAWQPLNEGLGSPKVSGISVGEDQDGSAVAFAATQGGVWRYGGAQRTPEPTPTATPEPTPTPTPTTTRMFLPLIAKEGGATI